MLVYGTSLSSVELVCKTVVVPRSDALLDFGRAKIEGRKAGIALAHARSPLG